MLLLVVLGRKGNDNLLPVAMVVVEAKTKNSWTWFLDALIGDIGNGDGQDRVFISHRQKGLDLSFYTIILGAEHRHCIRHLYDNLKKVFKGEKLNDATWVAAACGLLAEFETPMDKIKKLDENVRSWLVRENPNR